MHRHGVRVLISAGLLALLASPVAALSPLRDFDGCELLTGSEIGNSQGVSISPFQGADGDMTFTNDYARTGLSSCKLAPPGNENLVWGYINTCPNPDETLVDPCNGNAFRIPGSSQELTMSFAVTASPAVGEAPFMALGNRKCQDPPTSQCSLTTWDGGSQMVTWNWTNTKNVQVRAFKQFTPIPTPTPCNTVGPGTPTPVCHSTCKTTDILPLIGASPPQWDMSVIASENQPATSQLLIKTCTERYNATPARDCLDCAFDFTGANFPSARVHFFWDKAQAGGVATGLPILLDDGVWAQSPTANAAFLPAVRCYPMLSSSTSDAQTVTSEDVGDWTTTSSPRVSAISQSPVNLNKIMSGPVSCSDVPGSSPPRTNCTEDLILSTNSFFPTSLGAPGASAGAFPPAGTTLGPLELLRFTAYVEGAPPGATFPGVQVGIVDNGVACSNGAANISVGNLNRFDYTIHRSDGVNDAVGNSSACNQSSDFKCGPFDDGAPCPGGGRDYAHSGLRMRVMGLAGSYSQTLPQLVEAYGVACYALPTIIPDTPTPTVTRTFTLTRTATNTPTITNTPLASFTPTATRTPTITLTATRTATSGKTFTPSPTYGPTIVMPSDPAASVCSTQPCTFCAHSQPDLRIVLEKAKAQSSRCPKGVRVVMDRSFDASTGPTPGTDTSKPGLPLSGIPLFPHLRLVFLDQQRISFSASGGSGVHCDPLETCSDIVIDGGIWDGSLVPAGESIFDLYGIPDITLTNATIIGTNQVGVTFGGTDPGGHPVGGVVLSHLTFQAPAGFRHLFDAGGVAPLVEDIQWNVLTPTPTQ